MSLLTILFLVFFVSMIAMHLRGHGGHGGHDGGHGHSPPRKNLAEPPRPEHGDPVAHHNHDAPTGSAR